MVKDLIEVFKRAYEVNGDKMVLDVYKPKEGLYIKVNKDSIIEKLYINKDTSVDLDLYKWFRDRDYYSSLVDMNKPVDPKKQIHSNNCFSIFMKKEIFPEIREEQTKKKEKKDKKDRLSFEAFLEYLKNYYEALSALQNGEELKSESSFLHKLLTDKSKFDKIVDDLNKSNFKNYVKFFLDVDLNYYKNEYKKYLMPKIFNDEKYNIKLNEVLLGLSNNNMGMNSKKIYLEHKNTKYKVPFRITLEDALIAKAVFDWLKAQESNDLYIPEQYDFKANPDLKSINGSCYYINVSKGINVTIEDFEYLPSFRSKIDFLLKNYLQVDGLDNGYKNDLSDLEKLVDEYFFDKNLTSSYYLEVKKIKIRGAKLESLKNLLIMNIKTLHSFFRKGKNEEFLMIIEKLSFDAILIAGILGIKRLQNAFNLRMSLLKHYDIGGCKMADRILPIRELVIKRIKGEKELSIESDEEFYFLSGQIAYYLLTKSKAQNKNFNMLEPFFRTKTALELKTQINQLFEYYKHAVSIDDERFRALMGMFEGYQAETGIKQVKDIFLAGFLSKNIMFIKKEEM